MEIGIESSCFYLFIYYYSTFFSFFFLLSVLIVALALVRTQDRPLDLVQILLPGKI